MAEKVEPVSLVNKIVKVVDKQAGIDNTGIISFMYPDFLVKEEIFFDYENSIIFIGKYNYNLRSELEHGTKKFIALCDTGVQDIDFTDRETNIKVLYSKWNKKISDNTKEVLMNLNQKDFWDYFKKFWITGQSKLDDSDIPMYKLHSLLGGQRFEILKMYYQLRESYSDSSIFSSILSYIEKAMNPDRVSSQNGLYIKQLENFRKAYGSSIGEIILEIYKLPSDSDSEKTYRLLSMLMRLGKGEFV